MKLVDYITAIDPWPLPPIRAQMYEYVMAANGVFVRGRRAGLEVMLPVMEGPRALIRGLETIEPDFQLEYPHVPAGLMKVILDEALGAKDGNCEPVEALFCLTHGNGWYAWGPPQERRATFVRPINPLSCESAMIEVHSHHRMSPDFSSTDDADEVGFRIYAVLGNIFEWPTLRVRVGLYGHYWEIPASWIFEMPSGIVDANDEA